MGACIPKSPTCGEVKPSTKVFNVCCGGWVIIENSKIDGANGRKEGHYLKQKKQQKDQYSLHSLFYYVSKPSAYTGKTNIYHDARCLLPWITQTHVDRWFEGQLTLHVTQTDTCSLYTQQNNRKIY